MIEASRLGILKINPDMYWLSNLCRHYVLMFIGSTEPHRYIDYFVYSLLNIKLVFRYKNHFVSNCFSVFALKLSILSIILIIRCNQIVFPNLFPIIVSHRLLIFIFKLTTEMSTVVWMYIHLACLPSVCYSIYFARLKNNFRY